MEEISLHIQMRAFAWEVFMANAYKLFIFYGRKYASLKRPKSYALTNLSNKWNVLLSLGLRDRIVGIHIILSNKLKVFQDHNYQWARVYKMKQEFRDNICQRQSFFQG